MNFTKKKLKKVLIILFLIPSMFAFGHETNDLFAVAQYKSDKQCAISFTFDDGLIEHYTLVYPKFKELGFKATFWINGNTINEGELGRMQQKPRTTWSQLKEMAQHGFEISNHGWTHKQLPKCTPEEMLYEIHRNDSVIETKIGVKPITFCYPNNSKNSASIKAASKNRVGTRIEQFQIGSKSTPEILEEKLKMILENRQWYATMIHGITNGYDAFPKASILWDHLDRVKALEDKIWVDTFRDISAYTTEQEHIKLEVVQKGKKWIIIPNLQLDKELFKVPLTMVFKKGSLTNCIVKQNGKKLKIIHLADKILFDFDPNGGEIVVVNRKV